MRIVSTQRNETIFFDVDDKTEPQLYQQTIKKIVKVESSNFDELDLDTLDAIVVEAIKRHMAKRVA